MLAGIAAPEIAHAESTLREKAAAKGLVYGCAVGSRNLTKDRPFAEAVKRDAGILVHEYELKRKHVEPAPDKYDFTDADQVMAFAKRNNQLVRGHTLVWHEANPDWLAPALEKASASQKEKLLTDYVSFVVQHYKGQMQSWDVVNEVVDPLDGDDNGMRTKSPWYQSFGEDYIPLAFHTAAAADPHTPRFLNELNIESDERWSENRQTAVLKLLERMKAKDVPIDGFGIQGHLKIYRDSFDQEAFGRFLKELEGFGLKLMITEFDVADADGPTDPKQRDADVAAAAKNFLDVALASPAMIGVLSWGLTDRYSWLSSYPKYKWADGQLSRVLPYDGNMTKKPMWQAMANAFDAAPKR